MIDDSNDQANAPHKLLLGNTHILRVHKAFANNVVCNIKLSKTHLSKIGQSRGLLGRLLEPLLKTVLSLMKNALKPLGKKVLIPLGLTTARSATDAAVQKKIFGYG